VLCRLLNERRGRIKVLFKPLWANLNRYVHPSTIEMDKVAEADFAGLVTDSFNESLAKDFQKATDSIMDVIYAMVLERYPKAKQQAKSYRFIHEWERHLPITMLILHGSG
jgi:hypothetical protein